MGVLLNLFIILPSPHIVYRVKVSAVASTTRKTTTQPGDKNVFISSKIDSLILSLINGNALHFYRNYIRKTKVVLKRNEMQQKYL